MRSNKHIPNEASAREYADWLERHCSGGDLLARAQALFHECGPAMPRDVRDDLAEFLRERSERALARCIALNDDPRDDAEYARWLREREQP